LNIAKANGVQCRKPFARKDTAQNAILPGDKIATLKINWITGGKIIIEVNR
jgi:hypothetical protein